MHDYYARLFREMNRGLLRFSKQQIGVSLMVGIASAFVGEHLGTINPNLVRRSALVSVACYAVIFIGRALWGIIITPVKLDQQRVAEIQSRNSEIRTKQDRVTALEEALSKKHPHDEHKERQLLTLLGSFTEKERDALSWLLDNGETRDHDLPNTDDTHEAINKGCKTSPQLVIRRIEHLPGGNPSYYRINPNYESAIRDFFHPPSRSVRPPVRELP